MNFDERKLEIGSLKLNRNASLLMAIGFGVVIANIGSFETLNTVPFVLYTAGAIAETAAIYKLKKKQEGVQYMNPLSATLNELKSKIEELKLERNSTLINAAAGFVGAGTYTLMPIHEEMSVSNVAVVGAFLAAGLTFGKEAKLYHTSTKALKDQCPELQSKKRKQLK